MRKYRHYDDREGIVGKIWIVLAAFLAPELEHILDYNIKKSPQWGFRNLEKKLLGKSGSQPTT